MVKGIKAKFIRAENSIAAAISLLNEIKEDLEEQLDESTTDGPLEDAIGTCIDALDTLECIDLTTYTTSGDE